MGIIKHLHPIHSLETQFPTACNRSDESSFVMARERDTFDVAPMSLEDHSCRAEMTSVAKSAQSCM